MDKISTREKLNQLFCRLFGDKYTNNCFVCTFRYPGYPSHREVAQVLTELGIRPTRYRTFGLEAERASRPLEIRTFEKVWNWEPPEPTWADFTDEVVSLVGE